MKFGPVDLDDAEGAILAHSVKVDGGRIAKGATLDAAGVDAIRAAGHSRVWVARLEAGDLGEDAAAARMAEAVAGAGLMIGAAGTGRVNLRASGPGVLTIDAAAITAANAVNPGLTIATLPPFQRVEAGDMVATIKVIPYAIPAADLEVACTAARAALALAPPVMANATLIETRTTEAKPPDKGRRVTDERLSRLGVDLAPRVVVPHEVDAISAALQQAGGDLILILTGSATSDIGDVAPASVVAAGGRVAHYGMPVDPGNLLFLGSLGRRAIIGLPGCARSPALNGADWVLERVVCGIPVTSQDIQGMGLGGLLKEIPTRPMPRRGIARD